MKVAAYIPLLVVVTLLGASMRVVASDEEALRKAHQALAREDAETAFALWLPIARRGNPAVHEWVGDMYRTGKGVARDHQAARRWYERSARAGDIEGIYSLARLLATSPDPEVRNGRDAVKWAQRSVESLDVSESRNVLALALAEAGHFDQALEEQSLALEMFRQGRYVRGNEFN